MTQRCDDEHERRKQREALVFETAENMAIYAGASDDEPFLVPAHECIEQFANAHVREPYDYLELEEWARSVVERHHLFVVRT
jgi:hypothetical protein